MKRNTLLMITLLSCVLPDAIACTSFGFVNKNGTVIAKNSDFYYDKQSVEILVPNKQFVLWYNNTYGNNFKIFAQMANNNVKMGINEVGLTAMEEDPLLPKDKNQRRYIQPLGGTSECMTLWGVLQNFKTVDQLLPYLNAIFSHASPNHYEIADRHKILVVEVGYGINNITTIRPFSYKILDKPMDNYTHTNTYQDSRFINLNKLAANPYSVIGAQARNDRIKYLMKSADKNENTISAWLFDTTSNLNNPRDNKWCLGTSIFRSNIGDKQQIDNSSLHSDTYGTVASMIVFNNNSPTNTKIIVRIVDKISTDDKGNQTIIYKELQSPLSELFRQKYTFNTKQLNRLAPINGICK